jgi:hypothetical protein
MPLSTVHSKYGRPRSFNAPTPTRHTVVHAQYKMTITGGGEEFAMRQAEFLARVRLLKEIQCCCTLDCAALSSIYTRTNQWCAVVCIILRRRVCGASLVVLVWCIVPCCADQKRAFLFPFNSWIFNFLTY